LRKEAKSPDFLMVEAMKAVAEVADKQEIRILVIGATARALLLEGVYGLEPGRRTLDVDYAIAVDSWDDDRLLRETLENHHDFERDHHRAQRLNYRDVISVDIIPFGGIENEQGEIEWPNEDGVRLSVLSFSDLIESAVPVVVDGNLHVPVVSPEGLLASKLVAWDERRIEMPGRDAADIGYILRHAERIIGRDALFERHMVAVESSGYRLDMAAVSALGSRLAEQLGRRAHQYIQDIAD
jgi:predicted nucleotidyltransferase